MGLRRRYRKFKRLAWLATIVGAVVGVRRMTSARQRTPSVGPVASWPPLERSEPPVAAVGDLVTSSEVAEEAEEGKAPLSDEPVAAVGELATELHDDAPPRPT